MSRSTVFPEPSASQLRRAELFIFPLRTMLVIASLWLIHWMYSTFSLTDVSALYDVAIWFSIGLAILSVVRTTIAMRSEPGHRFLRDASYAVNVWFMLRSGELQRRIKRAYWPDAGPVLSQEKRADLQNLRRIDLLCLTPLRLILAAFFYSLIGGSLFGAAGETSWIAQVLDWIVAIFACFVIAGVALYTLLVINLDEGALGDARIVRDFFSRRSTRRRSSVATPPVKRHGTAERATDDEASSATSKVAALRSIDLFLLTPIRFGIVFALYEGYRRSVGNADAGFVSADHRLWPAAVVLAVVLFFLGNRTISMLLADEKSRHLRLARRTYGLFARVKR